MYIYIYICILIYVNTNTYRLINIQLHNICFKEAFGSAAEILMGRLCQCVYRCVGTWVCVSEYIRTSVCGYVGISVCEYLQTIFASKP